MKELILVTESELDIINGLLLSDASICFGSSRNKNAHFSITSACESFIEHLIVVLPFKVHITFNKPRKGGCINGRVIQGGKSFRITSICNTLFTELRNKWYPNGTKIVPDDLPMSGITMKYWFYGDGFCTYRERKGGQLGLCTDSFSEEECERLTKLIRQTSDVEFNVCDYKGRPRLYCYDSKEINKFFDHIGNFDVEGYSYKWKKPPAAGTTIRTDNTSGIKGVNFHKSSKKWAACVFENKKTKHLGLYRTKEEAAEARKLYLMETLN